LKTPFKISFEGKTEGVPIKTILQNFKENCINSHCESVKIIENKELIVKNSTDFLNWRRSLSIWGGKISARIKINKNKTTNIINVRYTIDFRRFSYTIIYFTLLFLFSLIISGFIKYKISLLMITIFLSSISIWHFVMILRHRSFFRMTLKHGVKPEYLGNYNWDSIIKNKNDNELIEIIEGRRQLPNSVIKMAKLEFLKRKKT